MNSENSQGYCVPTDSSANEVIAGLARASAVRDSGASSNHTVATAVGCAVGGAVLLLIVLAIGISIVVRRRRKERGFGSAELASIRSLPMVRLMHLPLESLLYCPCLYGFGTLPQWCISHMPPEKHPMCLCWIGLSMCQHIYADGDLFGMLRCSCGVLRAVGHVTNTERQHAAHSDGNRERAA